MFISIHTVILKYIYTASSVNVLVITLLHIKNGHLTTYFQSKLGIFRIENFSIENWLAIPSHLVAVIFEMFSTLRILYKKLS